MTTRERLAGWYRNRFVWVAVILLVVSAGAVVLLNRAGPKAEPADLHGQIMARMRTTLEQADPGKHNHAGHTVQQAATEEKPAVVCGVRVYGYEPAEVTALADVRTVYGFHLCGSPSRSAPGTWRSSLPAP